MPLLNPQLRELGPTPGSAKHWTLSSVCTAQRIAAFGPAPETAQEDFERWSVLVSAFVAGSLVLAFFDPVPKGYESFAGWNAGAFLETLPPALLEACSFAGSVAELFDGWPSAARASSWAEVSSEAAPVEDFEAWTAPTSPAWAAAAFSPGAVPTEAFAGAWPAMTGL